MFRIINTLIFATILVVVIIHADPMRIAHQPTCPTEAC